MKTLSLLALLVACAIAQRGPEGPRPQLFFREDFKETPPETPATQAHIANPEVVLGLYGVGKDAIKKSHHDTPKDDPYYIWSGQCKGNWAVTLKHRKSMADLSGLAKIRWRSHQTGFRQLRPVLKLADGTWLVGDAADGPTADWHEVDFNILDIRWRRLDIKTVVEGAWVEKPDLRRVDEIGFTDLMEGGGTPASSRLDWIEVWGKPQDR